MRRSCLLNKAAAGDTSAYQYATIYARWGDLANALEWLETALRLRDPGLMGQKTAPLLDPLRQEPRFKAIDAGVEVSGVSRGAAPTQFLWSLEDRSNVRYVEN